MINGQFDFEKEVQKYYKNVDVKKALLKDIYNKQDGRGKSTEDTIKKGIYALYFRGKLMKIGKATYKDGIFHRMSQYYRRDKCGGLDVITNKNRDEIIVLYANICENEIWFAERRLQVIAHDCGEKMPWECTLRN